MDYTYFAFAFFVFVLVIAAVFISKKIKSTGDKNLNYLSEQEKKLFKLYQSLEDMIAGAMEFMEEAKAEVAGSEEKIDEMLKRAEYILAEAKSNAESMTLSMPEKTEDTSFNQAQDEYKKPVLISNNMSRKEQVLLLKKEGQNIKQISKVLGMSQGEVKLIIGLNR
jgi:DNA-binding NarL/FixJ family response regulator